jgi:hypothetical protein
LILQWPTWPPHIQPNKEEWRANTLSVLLVYFADYSDRLLARMIHEGSAASAATTGSLAVQSFNILMGIGTLLFAPVPG